MKTLRTLVLVLAASAALVALAGCGKSSSVTNAAANLDTTPPAAPTAVHEVQDNSSDVLAWTAGTSADTYSYEIWKYATNPANGGSGSLYRNVAASVTAIALDPVPADCTEYYRIRAIDTSHNAGSFSSTVTITRRSDLVGTSGGGSDRPNVGNVDRVD